MTNLLSTTTKRILSLFLGYILPFLSFAQPMEITNAPPITPENLISNIFLGDGVEILTIDFEGVAQAVGSFKEGQNVIGIERGLVMTTGSAVSQGGNLGADDIGASSAGVDNGSVAEDDDLSALVDGQALNDVCKYSIQFIPISDTIRFRYAFASEEYPTFVCSQYNDVFGFFISGPGYPTPTNIARVPGTDLPVTINNVNNGILTDPSLEAFCTPPNGSLAFSEFFNDNLFSNTQPVYDGYLDVFEAVAAVQPCEVYTIKLVIADVTDPSFDSGVFLEAKSFGSERLSIETVTVSIDGSLAEGCSEGVLTFKIPSPAETNLSLDYQIFGSAQNGVDIATIPLDLMIMAGDTAVSVPLIALEDGLNEGDETLFIDVQRDVCNRDTVAIIIRDNILEDPDLGDDRTICLGDSVELDGTLSINIPPPPTFVNSSEVAIDQPMQVFTSTISVSNVFPITLGPDLIKAVCIDSLTHQWIDDLDIVLVSPGGQILELTTDNGADGGNGLAPDQYLQTCFTPIATTPINDPGPFAPASAVPFRGDWLPESPWSDLWDKEYPTNGDWQLQILDDSPSGTGTLHQWSICFNPIYNIQYAWQPTDGLSCANCPNPQASPTQTTDYTLTVIDSYGCMVETTVRVEVENDLGAPVLFCGNSTETSLEVSWLDIPGAMGYEVNVEGAGWEPANGLLSHNVTGLTLGQNINVEVRAIGNCPNAVASISCQTSNCPVLDLETTLIQPNCNGGMDGSITVNSLTGMAPFSFTLNGETNTTGIFSNLGAGSYLVSVEDAMGCTQSTSVELIEPEPIVLTSGSQSTGCDGNPDGVAFVTPSGGTTPYTFLWDGNAANQTTDTAFNLVAGIYSVTVFDANLCEIETTVEVIGGDVLSVVVSSNNPSCPGEMDGQIELTPSGGTGTITFNWENGANTATLINLGAGTYRVTVEDEGNCSVVQAITLTDPGAITIDEIVTPPSCYEGMDGEVELIVSGGVPPYQFDWGDQVFTDPIRSGLTQGTYTVVVQDANGCENSILFGMEDPDNITINTTFVRPGCDGSMDGAINTTVFGGTGQLTISWDNGQTGPNLTNVGAGIYTITVIDENNCDFSVPFNLTAQPGFDLEVIQNRSPSCVGDADGIIEVLANDPDVTFVWDIGQTGPLLENLPAGSYTVVAQSPNGCTIQQTINLFNPQQLIAIAETSPSGCSLPNSGEASVAVLGGTPPFQYSWNDPDNQTTETATGLLPGDYTVIVMDANGCSTQAQATVEVAPQLEIELAAVQVSCFRGNDGAIAALVTGGTGEYTYIWSDASIGDTPTAQNLSRGNFSVTVQDELGCFEMASISLVDPDGIEITPDIQPISCIGDTNGAITLNASGGVPPYIYTWGTGETSESLANLEAGVYTVNIEDANNCTEVFEITVPAASPVSLDFLVRDVLCTGDESGEIQLSIGGGAPPFLVEWSNGQNTTLLQNLGVGSYTVTVVDANNCETIEDVSIAEPTTSIDAVFEVTGATCFDRADGQIEIIAEGGTGRLMYSLDRVNFTNNPIFTGLEQGVYQVFIRDNSACIFESEDLIVDAPGELVVELPEDKIIEFGETIGLKPEIFGGVVIEEYQWMVADTSIISCLDCLLPTVSPTTQTTVRLRVTDANGCVAEDFINIFVSRNQDVFVPTGFSPDGDAINDRLTVFGKIGVEALIFRVFDRWGELVFEATEFPVNSETIGWDGRFRNSESPVGVYVWYLEAVFPDGSQRELRGSTTLVR